MSDNTIVKSGSNNSISTGDMPAASRPDRLVIKSGTDYYEIDRYCPHKRVDLGQYG
eukprot:Pgem_evm1s15949